MLFGAAYYPEHRDPARWDFDFDQMAAAGVNAVRVAEFAWKRLEPAEGQYDFGWLDQVLEKAAKRKIKLVLCPPLRTVPSWMVEKDRSVLIEDYQGRIIEFGSRYTFCINHPLLRERGFALASRMAERYGRSEDVAGWHLDNEFGCDIDCHCPICREKWQDWLADIYETPENLNKQWGNVFWGLEYDSFGQVPTPRISHTNLNPAQLKAWRQFRSDCTAELVREHAACVRPHSPGKFVSTNCQSPYTNPTDYYDMAKALDFCGTNYYPPFGDDCLEMSFRLAALRGYKPGVRGFHLYELRSGAHPVPGFTQSTPEPGAVERLTMHVVANGADAVFYFRWRICPFGAEQTWSALTGYEGQAGRIYEEMKGAKAKLDKIAPLLEGTEVISQAAVLWDYPARWSLDAGWILKKPDNLHILGTERAYAALRRAGFNCDGVGRHGDFDAYKFLVLPSVQLVDDELVAKLRRFVERGGTLAAFPFTGTKNMDCEIHPERMHPGLMDLFGVKVSEYATGAPEAKGIVSWKGKRWKAGYFFDLPKLHGAKLLARYASGWFKGTPAATERVFGRGKAVYLAAFPGADWCVRILPALARAAGAEPVLPGKIPAAVEITERRTPKGRRLVFLVNSTGKPQTVPVPHGALDIWAGRMAGPRLRLSPRAVVVLSFPS